MIAAVAEAMLLPVDPSVSSDVPTTLVSRESLLAKAQVTKPVWVSDAVSLWYGGRETCIARATRRSLVDFVMLHS